MVFQLGILHNGIYHIGYNISSMSRTIYSKDHKHLIDKLKKARIELGFDQAEVAKKLKKSQSYVSKIESGQRRLDIVQMNEFAKIYNKSIDYFLK